MKQAAKLNANYGDPLYNLGVVAYLENRINEAKGYWNQYLKLDAGSNWSKTLHSRYKVGAPLARPRGLISVQNEMLSGIQIGNYNDEVPSAWGAAALKVSSFKDVPFTTAYYKNGITTISEGDEIRAILANSHFSGESNRGIKIGVPEKKLLSAYGVPSNKLVTTQGTSWVYTRERITFQMRDGKVASWVIF